MADNFKVDQRTKDSSTVCSPSRSVFLAHIHTHEHLIFPRKCAIYIYFFLSFFFLRLLYLRKLLEFFSASLTCIDPLFHMPKGRVDQHVALMWRCVAHTDRSLMTGGFRGRRLCKAPRSVVYFLSNAVQVYKKKGVGGLEWGVVGGWYYVFSFTYICMLSAIVLPLNPNLFVSPKC